MGDSKREAFMEKMGAMGFTPKMVLTIKSSKDLYRALARIPEAASAAYARRVFDAFAFAVKSNRLIYRALSRDLDEAHTRMFGTPYLQDVDVVTAEPAAVQSSARDDRCRNTVRRRPELSHAARLKMFQDAISRGMRGDLAIADGVVVNASEADRKRRRGGRPPKEEEKRVVPVTVHLEPDLKLAAETLAGNDGRSLASLVRLALRTYVSARQSETVR